jgi:hypothetical protein
VTGGSLTETEPPAGTSSGPAADKAAAASERERLPEGTRLWFLAFVGWMAALALTALLLSERAKLGNQGALAGWLLALMCFYLSLCNSFVPLPTAWIVLLAASPGFAPFSSGWLNVLVVSGLATLATIVANLNEYHLLAWLLHFGLGRRVRRTKLYGWGALWFSRAPFVLLTLIAFIPIPVDAVRWMAILQAYPRTRYALAYLVGRGPRYAIFAGCSVLAGLTPRQILVIQIAIVVAAGLGRVVWRVVRGGSRSEQQQTTVGEACGGESARHTD